MIYKIERTQKEIDDLLNEIFEQKETGRSKFRGMTFEEGVEAAIRWLTDKDEESPMAE